MKVLLDTHAALWWWTNADLIGKAAREVLSDPATEVFFSAASSYEIAQKARLGKLLLPPELQGEGLIRAVIEENWQLLPLNVVEAAHAASLDDPHRDPFDRMLWSQANLGGLILASVDPFFRNLKIDVVWESFQFTCH